MSRKGENIYKRKDGRWEGRFIASYDENNKAKYRYLYARSYNEIKRKLIEAQNNNINITSSGKSTKYYDLIDDWLKMKKSTVKESTYIKYRNIIENHIKPEIGKYQTDKISTLMLKNFMLMKLSSGKLNSSGGLSVKTVSDIMSLIKDTMEYAKEQGTNIICSFDSLQLKKTQKEMRILSRSEEKRLVSVLLNNTDLYKLGVLICICTGIRIGELCALKWKDISLYDKTIEISHTMQRLQNEDKQAPNKTKIIITDPKSYSGKRIIPIPDFLVAIMKPFRCQDNCYLLSGSARRLVEPRTMQNKFKAILQESKIEDINFHALRHTFATRCIELGFDIKSLSEILGHSNVKITLDKYVHSSMQLKRTNMEKLNAIIN